MGQYSKAGSLIVEVVVWRQGEWSRVIQALGQKACVHGYRVLYRTSAELLSDLTASLADKPIRCDCAVIFPAFFHSDELGEAVQRDRTESGPRRV